MLWISYRVCCPIPAIEIIKAYLSDLASSM